MYKYYLDLIQENIDFTSKSFDRTFGKLGDYEFISDKKPSEIEKEIYNSVMQVKGDGMSLDYTESQGICYLKLSLIFTSKDSDEYDQKLIKESVDVVNDFISLNSNDSESSLTHNLIEKDTGIYISIKENGGSGLVNSNEIIELLDKAGVKSELISVNGNWYDRGASSGTESMLIFIMGAISSGITYDLIKSSLKMILQYDMAEISMFDNFRFKKMREIIIERTNVPKNEIILTEMYRSEKDIIFNFRTKQYKILVITNKDYGILELKMDEQY